MAAVRHAQKSNDDRPPRASSLEAVLLVVCALGCALATSAHAATRPHAHTTASHASSPAKRRVGCARRASFHSSSGAKRRVGHSVPCRGPQRRDRRGRRQRKPSARGACANTQLQPSAANVALIDAATLCLVNRERTSRGESALEPNVDLQRAALAHSSDMASGDYFAHDSRNGSTPLARMRAAGYIFSSRLGYAVGENIAWATLWLATPKAIVAGWMASPGHRANILDAEYRETGVGVSPHPLASLAHGESGAIYTQDFGRIIAP
jgi:uncharacterized protein YkwD